MRALALSGLVLGVLLTAARPAQADCGSPTWLGTPDAKNVPTSGVVYLHDEAMGWDAPHRPSPDPVEDFLKVEWVGVSGATIHVTRVEASVASIEYDGLAGSRLRVFDRYGTMRAEYVLDAAWQAPEQPPRVLQYWRQQHQWTCSWSDSLMIQLDQPAAAVRVRWTVNGHSVDYIEALQSDGPKAALELGKINCGGENMPLEQLIDGGGIELFAIRLDGTEVPIVGMPRYIALGDLEDGGGHLERAFTIVATQEPDASIVEWVQRDRVGERESRGLGVVIVVLAALGVFGALWLIRRVEKSGSGCSPAS